MKSFATLSLLFLSVAAHPDIFKRADCNRDNCLRQVVASNAAPGPAQGSADCSSFFMKTYTPCPVTSTVTTTSTPVVESTATETASTTSTTTTVVSATETSTITNTDIVTTTTTFTATTTTITTQLGAAKKRAIDQVFDALLPRAAAACTTVGSPSKIPTYASSCKSVAQYSSACSCNGISMSTTTLTPVTATTTTTATAAPRTTIVATTTTTTTLTATATNTQTSTATITTSATVTTTASTTTTTTVTSTYIPGYCQPGTFCGNRGSGECYCFDSVSGGKCAQTGGGCGQLCNADSDCGSGYACLTDCAFGGYKGSCAKAATDYCRNGNAARSIFAKANEVEKRDGGRSLPLIAPPSI